MKFLVTFKDPDGPYECIQDAAKEAVAEIIGIDEADKPILIESRAEKYTKLCSQWFEYGEYVTIEIDTEANTATICKAAL